MEINPSTVLQKVGVPFYIISGEEKTVKLCDRDFKKVADFFDYKLTGETYGFLKAGWYWLKIRR